MLAALLLASPPLSPAARGSAVPTSISRTPPEVYLRDAAPLLTPLAEILARPAPVYPAEQAVEVLVDETVYLVTADGRAVRVHQIAYRALQEPGIKTMEDDLFAYSRDWQSFHLAHAVAIHADGRQQTVADDAIIVQSPQRQADTAIYSDTTEVRVVYPKISVGGITHAITVTEDLAPRMPGAFTRRHSWGGSFPVRRERVTVQIAAPLASRLRWFSLGADGAEPERLELGDGSVRFSWRREMLPARRREIGRAPASQAGPATFVTTLASWDEVARWFQDLLAERDIVSPSLAAEADSWLRDIGNREEKIALLYAKVADEVRYTSLALGECDFRPRPADEVWSRRHGDCKDKSNLLVSLLRHAGIPAHLVLLDTSHLGLIDRRAPDYRVFDHAIVAIPEDGGGYRFLDPTIACAAPGTLSPGDADRDVLVVRDGRADWARTPSQPAGRLNYRFELELSAAGELSGWLTLTQSGIYGAWERWRFRDYDSTSRRNHLADLVRAFFPGASVVDQVYPDPAARDRDAELRVYFLVPPKTDSTAGAVALPFPVSTSLLFDLGSTDERETAYFLYQDETRVSASIKLPASLAPASLPAPFTIEAPTGRARAEWAAQPGELRAEFSLEITRSSVSPAEFPRFYRAMLALKSWVAQPLALQVSAGAGAPSVAVTRTVDLPLMPSGEGQLELIENRYPFSGDRALRRAALERAIQYFPDDTETVYTAGIRLALLDWNEDKNAVALERIDALLAAHRPRLSPDTVAWGESVRALILRDMGREEEALAVFSVQARNASINGWRRGHDALQAASLLENKDPAAAVGLLALCAPLVSEKQPLVLSRLAELLLRRGEEPRLRETLADIARAQPADLPDLLTKISEAAGDWTGDFAPSSRKAWAAIARQSGPRDHEALNSALARLETAELHRAVAEDIVRRLREALERAPLAPWLAANPAPAAARDWKAYERERNGLVEEADSDGAVRLAVRTLVSQPPSDQTLTYLWKAASLADWHERRAGAPLDYPVLPLLLELCDLVPNSHDTRFEAAFLRGAFLERRGDHAGQRALFEALFADPAFPPSFSLSAHARLGSACEKLGDYESAIRHYAELKGDVADSSRNADCVLRAVYLNLHLDRPAEALALIQALEATSEKTLLEAQGEHAIRELVELRRSGRAEAFWAARSTWWPRWEKLSASLKLPAPGADFAAPVIPDLQAFGRELGARIRANDNTGLWRQASIVFSAARWLPSLAPETAGLQAMLAKRTPAHKKALADLVLAQLSVPGVSAENLELRALHETIVRFDSGDPAGALAACARYRRDFPAGTAYAAIVARVRALAAQATRSEVAEAVAELEQLLADPQADNQRALTVEVLSGLLRSRRSAEDEARLLERELALASVRSNQPVHDRLAARRDELTGGLRFAGSVNGWLRARPLVWFDYATPANLEDPRLRDLDTVLQDPTRVLGEVEAAKLQLLVAQAAHLGLAKQREAFADAVARLRRLAPTHALAREIDQSVLDDVNMDPEVRGNLLWTAIFDAVLHRRREDFARLREHPAAADFQPQHTAYFDVCARLLAIDETSATDLAGLADTLRAGEVGNAEKYVLHEVFLAQLRLDNLPAARALADSIPGWQLPAGASQSAQDLALAYARELRAAEALLPIHRAAEAALRARISTFPGRPPAAHEERRQREDIERHAPATTRDMCLWMLEARRYPVLDVELWRELIHALQACGDQETALSVFAAAVGAAPDDATRAELLLRLAYALDLDDAATRERVLAAAEPHETDASQARTALAVRRLKLEISSRQGEAVDLEAAWDALRDNSLALPRLHQLLEHYLQREDASALRRILQRSRNSDLLSPGLLPLTLPAFERAGLAAEARIAREAAAKEFKAAVLDAWVTGSSHSVSRATRLAESLGTPGAFPGGWLDTISQRCADPQDIAAARMMDAWLRADWPAAAAHAEALIRDYPSYYDFYWYAGASWARAGRPLDARPRLETFVRYSRNDVHHPEAVRLLETMR